MLHQIQEKDDQNARTKAEADTKVKEAETERDTAVTAKNKAESDLAAEQQKYAADIKKLNDQLASLTQSTADNNRKFSSDVQKEQEEIKNDGVPNIFMSRRKQRVYMDNPQEIKTKTDDKFIKYADKVSKQWPSIRKKIK